MIVVVALYASAQVEVFRKALREFSDDSALNQRRIELVCGYKNALKQYEFTVRLFLNGGLIERSVGVNTDEISAFHAAINSLSLSGDKVKE